MLPIEESPSSGGHRLIAGSANGDASRRWLPFDDHAGVTGQAPRVERGSRVRRRNERRPAVLYLIALVPLVLPILLEAVEWVVGGHIEWVVGDYINDAFGDTVEYTV